MSDFDGFEIDSHVFDLADFDSEVYFKIEAHFGNVSGTVIK
jgi:hypothetical protein